MAELIGNARCPSCSSEKAVLTLSAKKLAVLTCNRCNCQMFARSDASDEGFRKWLVPARVEQLPVAPRIEDGEPAPITKAQAGKPGRAADDWYPL